MTRRAPRSPQLRSTWLMAACLGALVGCQRGIYRADALPAHLAAPPTANMQAIDLSRLSSHENVGQTIQRGDVLAVALATGMPEASPQVWNLRVADDGTIEAPLIGPVSVAGRELLEAEQALRDASIARGMYRQPTISVQRVAQKMHRITVMGAVTQPGTYELPASHCDLLAALVAAGGLAEDADTRIEIRAPLPTTGSADSRLAEQPAHRPVAHWQSSSAATEARTTTVDLLAATAEQQARAIPLAEDSVIMVERQLPRRIHVMGLVEQPGQYDIPPSQDLHVLDALAMARGLKYSIADKVYVIRDLPHAQEPAVIQVSVKEAKMNQQANLRLAAGDVVSVEETPGTFTLGLINTFVRFGFSTTVF